MTYSAIVTTRLHGCSNTCRPSPKRCSGARTRQSLCRHCCGGRGPHGLGVSQQPRHHQSARPDCQPSRRRSRRASRPAGTTDARVGESIEDGDAGPDRLLTAAIQAQNRHEPVCAPTASLRSRPAPISSKPVNAAGRPLSTPQQFGATSSCARPADGSCHRVRSARERLALAEFFGSTKLRHVTPAQFAADRDARTRRCRSRDPDRSDQRTTLHRSLTSKLREVCEATGITTGPMARSDGQTLRANRKPPVARVH